MASSLDPKEVQSADSVDISTQENVSPLGLNGRQSAKQQVRHRASVACASCRDRRIRCVVPKNQTACTACQRSGAECIIKNDDERRRPISKAYMSSLSDRISMLEGMLLDKGVTPPPAAHPPKTRHDAPSKTQEDGESISSHPKQKNASEKGSPTCDIPSPPDSRNDDFAVPGSEHGDASNMSGSQVLQPLAKEDSPFRMLDPKQEDIIHRLLSTKGNLSFDQIGRLRFFGPTANSHVYADSSDQFDSREPAEQVRRAERIIRSFSIETHDYLMNQFFTFYNSVLKVIDRDAFESDRESRGTSPKFYSSFLHVTILAMGYRAADMERDDMRKITLAPRESTLHREAKYMLDIELERPGGIPSVQALLLLGDLECGVGRDNTGWMYSGMANRLAFDIGLHLSCRSHDDMPEQESQIRNMVMRACIIYDRYWGLFLGRPLAIKSQDVDLLSNRFSQLTSVGFEPPKRDLVTEIYEQLIELMELAGRIVETRDNSTSNRSSDPDNLFAAGEAEDNAYLHVINLDRQLQNWYRRLPEYLAWKPSSIKTAPFSYFLLHQQYHVTMILLHRPWAKYGSITGDSSSTGSHPSPASDRAAMAPEAATPVPMMATGGHSLGMGDSHTIVHDSRTSLSRSICTQQAIRVARIFWQHRQRYDGRKIFVTGIQHAGTAAIALIAALAYQRNEADRRTYVGYLEILSDAIGDMSETYHPASRIHELLKAVLEQIRNSMGDPPRPRCDSTSHQGFPFAGSGRSGASVNSHSAASILPLRREAEELGFVQPLKKRRPGSSRRASEFTVPRPPFFNAQAQPTPPASFKSQGQLGSSMSQSQSSLDSILFSMGVGDTSNPLNMSFLGDNAIDMEPHEDTHEHAMGRMDMDLGILPSSETWGLDNLQHHQVTGSASFDPPVANWTSGPAGLSASSVLGQSAAISTGIMSGAPKFGGLVKDEGGPVVSKAASNTGKKNSTTTIEQNGGVNWMEDDNITAISPVSLSGLIHTAEKTPNEDEGSTNVPRNHALDFFSFS
ncbi:fungal-specific transcription factor domain-containing protein [Thelonectria olida]|uniref:Fungal-specific transcription factor domain-containing protein n=1 Tax=Thelonectria olida TaxID=1576542 RepID=A0A9P8W032_9HYPO|nr:fungal-specific transcription factor domain-containing protein [Thelonectria olida]